MCPALENYLRSTLKKEYQAIDKLYFTVLRQILVNYSDFLDKDCCKILEALSLLLAPTNSMHTKLVLELLDGISAILVSHSMFPQLFQSISLYIQTQLKDDLADLAENKNLQLALDIIYFFIDEISTLDGKSYSSATSLAIMLVDKDLIGKNEHSFFYKLLNLGFNEPKVITEVNAFWKHWINNCIYESLFSSAQVIFKTAFDSFSKLTVEQWHSVHLLYLFIKKKQLVEGLISNELTSTVELIYANPEVLSLSSFFVSFTESLLEPILSERDTDEASLLLLEQVILGSLFKEMLPLQTNESEWVLVSDKIFSRLIIPHSNSKVRFLFFEAFVDYLSKDFTLTLSRSLEIISIVFKNCDDEQILSSALSFIHRLIDNSSLAFCSFEEEDHNVCDWGILLSSIANLIFKSEENSSASLLLLIDRKLIPLLQTISQNDALSKLAIYHCKQFISIIKSILELLMIELNSQISLLELLWVISDEILLRMQSFEKEIIFTIQMHLYETLSDISTSLRLQLPVKEGSLQMLFRSLSLHQKKNTGNWNAIFEKILLPLLRTLSNTFQSDEDLHISVVAIEGILTIFKSYSMSLDCKWIEIVCKKIFVKVLLESNTEKMRISLLSTLLNLVKSFHEINKKREMIDVVLETWLNIAYQANESHLDTRKFRIFKTDTLLQMIFIYAEMLQILSSYDISISGDFLEKIISKGLIVLFSIFFDGGFGCLHEDSCSDIYITGSVENQLAKGTLQKAALKAIHMVTELLYKEKRTCNIEIIIRLSRLLSFWYLNLCVNLTKSEIVFELISSFGLFLELLVTENDNLTISKELILQVHLFLLNEKLFLLLCGTENDEQGIVFSHNVKCRLVELHLSKAGKIFNWMILKKGNTVASLNADKLFLTTIKLLHSYLLFTTFKEEEFLIHLVTFLMIKSDTFFDKWILDSTKVSFFSLLIKMITFMPTLDNSSSIGVFREKFAIYAVDYIFDLISNFQSLKNQALDGLEKLLATIQAICTCPKVLAYSTLPSERYFLSLN